MIVVIIPVFVTVFLHILAAFGLLWSPIAAITCGRAARARGLDTRRYAIAGAIYSILLFLPWIYLWSKLRNKPLSDSTITLGYMFVYGLWLLGPVVTVTIFIATSFPHDRDPIRTIILSVMLAMVAISFLHFKFPTVGIRRADVHSSGKQSSDMLIVLAYIMPFIYSYIAIALMLLFFTEASPLTESLTPALTWQPEL